MRPFGVSGLYSCGISPGSRSRTCALGGTNGRLSPIFMPGGMACEASTPGLRVLCSAMSRTRGGMMFIERAMP